LSNAYQTDLFKSIFRTDGNVGILALSTSVFGGITVGVLVAYLFNRFRTVELPN
jgi:phosphotransferase system  glucose/maltose/N-acetylglucosamine-specific IIC component